MGTNLNACVPWPFDEKYIECDALNGKNNAIVQYVVLYSSWSQPSSAREQYSRSVQFSSPVAANSMMYIPGVMYDSAVLSSSCPIAMYRARIRHSMPTNSMHYLARQRFFFSLHQSMLSDRRRQEP